MTVASRPTALRALVASVAAATLLLLPGTARADDGGVREWGQVPAQVVSTQTVWEPTVTVGLELHPTTDITIQACQGQKGYVIAALYGGGSFTGDEPEFAITESPGCADSGYTFYGPVRTYPTRYGSFTVFGQCGWDSAKGKPVAEYDGGPCPASSVKSTGGLIIYTQGARTKGALKTSVVVTSDGLSLGQLVAIGKGLRPLRS